MPQPILFPIVGLHLNTAGTGIRKRGVAPNFCGGRVLPPVVLTIAGVTKDETGAATGGFTVYLFDMTSGKPVLAQCTVSDGAGAYSFSVGRGGYWAVDYKVGTPDKAGASVMPLAGI